MCLHLVATCFKWRPLNNGKWYTLRDSPQFNRDGIGRHKNIGFSKHGNLIATLGWLVARSPSGLSARELAQKLQHPCHAVLSQLHKNQGLDRVKVAGEFRYLALEEQTNRRQRQQAAVALPPDPGISLSTPAAVWVLVEHIKNPRLSFEQIAARLQEQRQLTLAPESIRRFFQEHDLKKRPQHRCENVADLSELSAENGPGEFRRMALRGAAGVALSLGPNPLPRLSGAAPGLQNPGPNAAHAAPGWLYGPRNAAAVRALPKSYSICG